MAASATQNPAIQSESKSARKKKAKAEAAATASPVTEVTSLAAAPESSNGDASLYESPYIKELYKSIRNVNKKITNASKVDNILAENPEKSLDELVASRKINADQKAQILKKPSLQAQLAQLEEQIANYKKFDQEYKAKAQAEKAELEKTFTDKAAKELEEAVSATKEEAAATATKEQHDNLLLLSQFLRLAAARRAEDVDSTLDENMALEGVLVEVYSGDENAVATMAKLINGSDEQTSSVSGEKLNTTYAQVKAAAVAYAPAVIATEATEEQGFSVSDDAIPEYQVGSDPTIVNAGLTELDAVPTSDLTNGHDEVISPSSGIPQNSGFGDGAANAAAENLWDTNNDLSASSEWVDVKLPRDVAETETGLKATPAGTANTQSWADEQPESPKPTGEHTVPTSGDGFHEVQRSRGNRDRDGQNFRGGRGGRGGYRGRGEFRGDGSRGRGRGGPRGGAAAGNRGPRPQES